MSPSIKPRESYFLECSYSSQRHSTTKFSPFELNYGVQLACPYSIGWSGRNPSASQYLKDMRHTLDMAKRNTQFAMDREMFC